MSNAHHAPLLCGSLLVVMRQNWIAGETKRRWWWAKCLPTLAIQSHYGFAVEKLVEKWEKLF